MLVTSFLTSCVYRENICMVKFATPHVLETISGLVILARTPQSYDNNSGIMRVPVEQLLEGKCTK